MDIITSELNSTDMSLLLFCTSSFFFYRLFGTHSLGMSHRQWGNSKEHSRRGASNVCKTKKHKCLCPYAPSASAMPYTTPANASSTKKQEAIF